MIKPRMMEQNPKPPEEGTDEVEQVIGAPAETQHKKKESTVALGHWKALMPWLCWSWT